MCDHAGRRRWVVSRRQRWRRTDDDVYGCYAAWSSAGSDPRQLSCLMPGPALLMTRIVPGMPPLHSEPTPALGIADFPANRVQVFDNLGPRAEAE